MFSNAAIHWIKPVDDVIAGVWRALLPGGRFVARVRRLRMCRDDQARIDRSARAPRNRRRRAQSVVFPDGRGLFRAPRSPRFCRQLHRVDSAAHSAADRNQRMARDIRAKLHGPAGEKRTRGLYRRGSRSTCVPSSATATANGSPTTFASDLPPTSRAPDAPAVEFRRVDAAVFAQGEMSIFRELTEGLPRQAPGSAAATLRALGLVRGLPMSAANPRRRMRSRRADDRSGPRHQRLDRRGRYPPAIPRRTDRTRRRRGSPAADDDDQPLDVRHGFRRRVHSI